MLSVHYLYADAFAQHTSLPSSYQVVLLGDNASRGGPYRGGWIHRPVR